MQNIPLDYYLFFFMVAALQGFILSSIIIFQKPVKTPSVFLGILLFLFSLSLLHNVLEESIHAFNARFPIPMSFSLTYGPLAYFHIRSITGSQSRAGRKLILHLIPSFLIEVLFFIGFFIYVRFNMEWAYANLGNIQLLFLLFGVLTFLHMTVYGFIMYRRIKKTLIKPEDLAKYIGNWFKTFSILWIFLTLFLGITIIVAILNLKQLDGLHVQYPLSALVSICVYWLGYKYLLKYSPVVQKYLTRINAVKYSVKEIEERKRQLLEALVKQELYKDENLSVDSLARHLQWPMRDISMVIGEAFGTNFNDLINSYRINAFKFLVTQPENKKYTMMALAQKAGFSSKASFYRAFKKIEGQTPGEFLNDSSGK